MANVKFDGNPVLGAVISNYEVFCEWQASAPIEDISQVTSKVCGHKFSKICGFNFQSALEDVESPIFQIVYCPKARSTHVRNDRGLHGWYIWKHLGPTEKQVMSAEQLLAEYKFDVGQFFQSDLFQKSITMLKSQIEKAYKDQVVPFVSKLKMPVKVTTDEGFSIEYSPREAKFYSKCVIDSMSKIADVLKTNWEKPEEMKAKLAYNADKNYSLNMRNTLNTWDGNVDESELSFSDFSVQTIHDLKDVIDDVADARDEASATAVKVEFRDSTGRKLFMKSIDLSGNVLTFALA